jgi:hypothetical protein
LIEQWMLRFAQKHGTPDLWVLGGAIGGDRQAEVMCLDRHWPHAVLYPLYARYGRVEAPKRRNLDMVEMVATSARGTFLAFPQPNSRGTYHCMTAATHMRVRLFAALPTLAPGWRP